MNNKAVKIYLLGFCIWTAVVIAVIFLARIFFFVPGATIFNYDESPTVSSQLEPFDCIELRQLNSYTRFYDYNDGIETTLGRGWLILRADSAVSSPRIVYPENITKLLSWEVDQRKLTLTVDLGEVESSRVILAMEQPVEIVFPAASVSEIEVPTVFSVGEITLTGDFGSELRFNALHSATFSDMSVGHLAISPSSTQLTGKPSTVGSFNYIDQDASSNTFELLGAEIGSMTVTVPDTLRMRYDIDIVPRERGRGNRRTSYGSLGSLRFLSAGVPDSTELELTLQGALPPLTTFERGIRSETEVRPADRGFRAICNPIDESTNCLNDNEYASNH